MTTRRGRTRFPLPLLVGVLLTLVGLLLAGGARADVVTSVVSPLGGGGVPQDTSTQANFCGPDAGTNVEIGSCTTDANAGTGGTSTVIGNGATNSGNATGVIVIGSGVTNSGNAPSNICIGTGATCATTTTGGIAIGPGVNPGTGANNVVIGNAAQHSLNGNVVVAIGASAIGGERGTAIGGSANATGGVAIGAAAVAGVNEFVSGSTNTANTPINNAYFGKGKTSATAGTASDFTLNGTGGLGSDIAGAAAWVAGGRGTGLALGGATGFKRPIRTTTGSAAQALANALVVCPSITLSTTSATTTTIATITTTSGTAGSLTMDYGNLASNGSVTNADSGLVKVSWNNNAGTVAAAMTAVALQSDSDASGTLAATPTVTVATNVVSIKLTPTWTTIVPTSVVGFATFTVHSNTAADVVVCQ